MKRIREEVFRLCYSVPGFTYDVDLMGPDDRDAYLQMLVAEKKREGRK